MVRLTPGSRGARSEGNAQITAPEQISESRELWHRCDTLAANLKANPGLCELQGTEACTIDDDLDEGLMFSITISMGSLSWEFDAVDVR